MNPKNQLRQLVRRASAPLPPDARRRARQSGASLLAAGIGSIPALVSIDTNAVPDPSLRAFAMWLLSRTQPPDAASALLCGAIDDDPKVRCEALAGLSGVDLPDAIDRLIAGLQDPYVNARVISALSLGGRQQAEVLVQTLQDPNQPAIDAAPQQKRSRTFVPRSNRSCEPR